MISNELAKRIQGDAREKIARKLYEDWNTDYSKRDLPIKWVDLPDYRKQSYLDWVAKQALSLSGTTEVDCEECEGETMVKYGGNDGEVEVKDCPECNGTGVTKHNWSNEIVLEDGELPAVKEDYPFEREETQLDMLNAKYRQVVPKERTTD